jgi:hypothetical protein
MRVAISQSNYIPWKGYFDMINMADVFVIYDCVQYTKNDWRNRNLIKTGNGLFWLSIPVQMKHKRGQKINETLISQKNWAEKHWKTLLGNYSRTRYFKLYKDVFEDLYSTAGSEYLSEINQRFLEKICGLLEINTRFVQSSVLDLQGERTEKLVNVCRMFGADTYLTGPAARNYLNEDLFRAHGIRVEWMNYEGYPEYTQLFPPFEHAVSILDLIFNEGPEARNYMKSFNNR